MDYVPRKRGTFSDRENIDKIDDTVQLESFNERVRSRLINFNEIIFAKSVYSNYEIAEYIYTEIFVLPINQYKGRDFVRMNVNRCISESWNYSEILSYFEPLIGYIISDNYYYSDFHDINLVSSINGIFEHEFVGYRMINGKFTNIVSKIELEEVNKALQSPFNKAHVFISNAINLIFNRDKPDFANGMKDCILAVESACNEIAESKVTLGKALSLLENKITIHPALKNAFTSLYGYTSDQDGIRHSYGLDSIHTLAEAQYMLVSCSAFINYLASNQI
ncbi:MAG: hypothetical protein JEZ05_01230 [Tenericutes bacterium]|nr:hypothetical protein [Mycoplasmatota bacterium]